MADVHTKKQRSYNMSRIKSEESITHCMAIWYPLEVALTYISINETN